MRRRPLYVLRCSSCSCALLCYVQGAALLALAEKHAEQEQLYIITGPNEFHVSVDARPVYMRREGVPGTLG